LLVTIGSMRMFFELLFKMLVGDRTNEMSRVSDRLSSCYTHRRYFVMPGALTRQAYLVLCSHPTW